MDSNNESTGYNNIHLMPINLMPGDCKSAGMTVARIAGYMLGFFFIVFLCNFLHILLRPLSQPRLISECIVNLSISLSLVPSLPPIQIIALCVFRKDKCLYLVSVCSIYLIFVRRCHAIGDKIATRLNWPEKYTHYSNLNKDVFFLGHLFIGSLI